MKHTNKHFLALLLAGAMVIGMAACGSEDMPDQTGRPTDRITTTAYATDSPATTTEPPAATVEPPATTTEAPVTTTTVPVTTTATPVTAATAPTTTTEVPVTTTTAPVTTTKAPVTTTKAPVTTTKAPVTTTKAPVTTTKAPVTTTTAPVTTTKAPVTTTKAPVTTTKAPVTTTKAPVTTTKAPVTTTKAPVTTTNAPVTEPIPVVCSHNYKVSATVDATCTAKGSKTYTCSKCGDTYSETIAMTAHKYADATCTAPKTCTVCGAITGKALGHNFDHNVCPRCGEEDPRALKQVYAYNPFFNKSPYNWSGEFVPVGENGEIDYDVIMDTCDAYFYKDEYHLGLDDPWLFGSYAVPEDVFLAQLKKLFEISDAKIEEIKNASPFDYRNLLYYENGYFYIDCSYSGSPPDYAHTIVSYTDQDGVLTTYVDYTTYNVYGDTEPVHQFYYAVEYHYSGTSDFRIYSNKIESDSQALIDSIKIVSAKKVDAIPDDAIPAQTQKNESFASYSYSFDNVHQHESASLNYKIYDNDPTVAVLERWESAHDGCIGYIINGDKITCKCGSVVFTDAELRYSDHYSAE